MEFHSSGCLQYREFRVRGFTVLLWSRTSVLDIEGVFNTESPQ